MDESLGESKWHLAPDTSPKEWRAFRELGRVGKGGLHIIEEGRTEAGAPSATFGDVATHSGTHTFGDAHTFGDFAKQNKSDRKSLV